jgi:hypothetical protein
LLHCHAFAQPLAALLHQAVVPPLVAMLRVAVPRLLHLHQQVTLVVVVVAQLVLVVVLLAVLAVAVFRLVAMATIRWTACWIRI